MPERRDRGPFLGLESRLEVRKLLARARGVHLMREAITRNHTQSHAINCPRTRRSPAWAVQGAIRGHQTYLLGNDDSAVDELGHLLKVRRSEAARGQSRRADADPSWDEGRFVAGHSVLVDGDLRAPDDEGGTQMQSVAISGQSASASSRIGSSTPIDRNQIAIR